MRRRIYEWKSRQGDSVVVRAGAAIAEVTAGDYCEAPAEFTADQLWEFASALLQARTVLIGASDG